MIEFDPQLCSRAPSRHCLKRPDAPEPFNAVLIHLTRAIVTPKLTETPVKAAAICAAARSNFSCSVTIWENNWPTTAAATRSCPGMRVDGSSTRCSSACSNVSDFRTFRLLLLLLLFLTETLFSTTISLIILTWLISDVLNLLSILTVDWCCWRRWSNRIWECVTNTFALLDEQCAAKNNNKTCYNCYWYRQ